MHVNHIQYLRLSNFSPMNMMLCPDNSNSYIFYVIFSYLILLEFFYFLIGPFKYFVIIGLEWMDFRACALFHSNAWVHLNSVSISFVKNVMAMGGLTVAQTF